MSMPKNFFNDWNVIHFYSRAEAIADGVLHDVTDVAQQHGFKIPVAITDTIWHRWIEASPEQKEYGQSTEARLRDVLTVLLFTIHAMRKKKQSRITFAVRFLMDAANEKYDDAILTADIGPGDEGEPVLTILIPEYDD